jgi:tRNA C32,U32 (ribose-2'-O)-methylase TrmJ
MTGSPPPPPKGGGSGHRFVVVLSNPETPENIGFVARSMAAYGVTELRLVGIPEIPADSKAYWTTCGGEDVLRNAKYYPDVAAAVNDCAQALGFTRRVRDKSQRLYDFGDVQRRHEGRLGADHPHYFQMPDFAEGPEPSANAQDPSPLDGSTSSPGTRLGDPNNGACVTALVFGCESKGLSHEETLAMTHLVRIALAAEDMSLNLSHAVTVVLHGLTAPGIKRGPWSHPQAGRAATLEESSAALEDVLAALDASGYLGKGGKESARLEKVGVLWRRLRPTAREIDFIRGALKALAGAPSKRLSQKSGTGKENVTA